MNNDMGTRDLQNIQETLRRIEEKLGGPGQFATLQQQREGFLPQGEEQILREVDPSQMMVQATLVMEPMDIQVKESDRDVDTGVIVRTNQRVVINASGEIWAGVWFTGTNGPQGWLGHSAGPNYPLPYTSPFSALGKLGGRYFYVGTGRNFIWYGGDSRLYLRINDDAPGNGWGAFTCHVEVYSG